MTWRHSCSYVFATEDKMMNTSEGKYLRHVWIKSNFGEKFGRNHHAIDLNWDRILAASPAISADSRAALNLNKKRLLQSDLFWGQNITWMQLHLIGNAVTFAFKGGCNKRGSFKTDADASTRKVTFTNFQLLGPQFRHHLAKGSGIRRNV